jgi:hypothetical protein
MYKQIGPCRLEMIGGQTTATVIFVMLETRNSLRNFAIIDDEVRGETALSNAVIYFFANSIRIIDVVSK